MKKVIVAIRPTGPPLQLVLGGSQGIDPAIGEYYYIRKNKTN